MGYRHEKENRMQIARPSEESQLEAWRHGVVLEDGHRTAPVNIKLEGHSGSEHWLRIVMREGHKRQIRETGARIGLTVIRIIRVRIGSLTLGNLKPRQYRMLSAQEIQTLKSLQPPVKVNP